MLFIVTGALLKITDLIAGGAIAAVYIAARFVGKSLGVLGRFRFLSTGDVVGEFLHFDRINRDRKIRFPR